mgnify:CR=1 FL=1
MKRYILSAAFILMSLCFGDRLSAGNFGVLGGADFYTYNPKEIGEKTLTQWHAGMAYKFNLPLGFQIQPTLIYSVKETILDVEPRDFSVGYLELLASVQWGVDLILFRPFIEASPFVGYALNGWGDFKNIWAREGNKLEYGIGLGGGLQIWRFQVNARYNWNFGRIFNSSSESALSNVDFSGVTLSLAYFF